MKEAVLTKLFAIILSLTLTLSAQIDFATQLDIKNPKLHPLVNTGFGYLFNKSLTLIGGGTLDYFRQYTGIQHSMNDYNPGFFKRDFGPDWVDIVREKKDTASIYPFSRRLSVSMNLSAFLLGFQNFDIKGHVLKENVFGRFSPQMTIGLNSWSSGLANLYLNSLDFSIKIFAVSPYLMASKSISKNVKAYGGYKLTLGKIQTKSPSLDMVDILGGNPSGLYNALIGNVDIPLTSHEIFSGITVLLPSGRETSMTSGFFFARNDQIGQDIEVYLKSEIIGKFFGAGITFTPLNFFRLRPYIRFRINI